MEKNILHVIPICCGKYVQFQFPFAHSFRYNFIVYRYTYNAVGASLEHDMFTCFKNSC